MNDSLIQEVIATDHRLEKTSERASEELARHRWHWTLDESNSDRMSLREYARQVGRGETTIRASAHAYLTFTAPGHRRTWNDSLERARVGSEKEAVIESIAEARGQAFSYIRQERPEEIRRVRQLAQERAEEKGTTVEEEAPRIAQFIVRSEQTDIRQQEERKARHGMRFIEMEGHLSSALRPLAKADQLAGELQWDEEDRDLLRDTIDQIRRLLNRIDAKIAGVKAFDLDAELDEVLRKVG